VIGVILEAVLGVLLGITLVRDARARRAAETAPAGPDGANVPAALRWVLKWVLGVGMVAIAGVLISALNLPVFTGTRPPRLPPLAPGTPSPTPRKSVPSTFHFPLDSILYGLLILALVLAVAASVWWAARLRRPAAARPELIAEDSEDLRDAVEEGRAALAELDDARAAIIACYAAMERSLADRGAARSAADTPDELLARAVASGVVRGPAARRLTGLFYEARFSTHPLGPEQRDAARQALDDLAAELRTPVEPVS
jgi:hypothetical protein